MELTIQREASSTRISIPDFSKTYADYDVQSYISNVNAQGEYLVKLMELSVSEGSALSTTATPQIVGDYLNVLTAMRSFDSFARTSPLPVFAESELSRVEGIALSSLLKVGSVLTGGAAALSIVGWLLGGSVILSPYVAILTLIASPFFFAMGKLVQEK